MLRLMLTAVVAALIAGLPFVAAQDKEKPKTPPRIAVDDPAKLKDDVDFALQGEYEGIVTEEGEEGKIGLQVIALGNQTFTICTYKYGLPGTTGKVELMSREDRIPRESDRIVFVPKATKQQLLIQNGKAVFSGEKRYLQGELKKVVRTLPTLAAKPPEGAVVLFAAAGDEKNWQGGKLVKLPDGEFLNTGIKTLKAFTNFTAHVEFRLPWMPNARGQGRGNSGVYLQDRYEVQVLDSFGLKGENNECGGIYTQYKPLVNMCLPPLTWQTYDIDFTAAKFDADGKKTAGARLTLKHNGVLIHDNVELKGSTGGGQPEKPTPGPFQLQNHGDPVVFRNIWVVEK